MAEKVPVRCPACLKDNDYVTPVFPCACGNPVVPPLDLMSPARPLTHRTWSEGWVAVRCGSCGRESEWPHPEVGCTGCGTVLHVPVHPVHPEQVDQVEQVEPKRPGGPGGSAGAVRPPADGAGGAPIVQRPGDPYEAGAGAAGTGAAGAASDRGACSGAGAGSAGAGTGAGAAGAGTGTGAAGAGAGGSTLGSA
ncbi:hypothetical protein GPJ59_15810, partial [Streptomyces bambusae]|nr:hypothetical protein [Streptomyces bambusae]